MTKFRLYEYIGPKEFRAAYHLSAFHLVSEQFNNLRIDDYKIKLKHIENVTYKSVFRDIDNNLWDGKLFRLCKKLKINYIWEG